MRQAEQLFEIIGRAIDQKVSPGPDHRLVNYEHRGSNRLVSNKHICVSLLEEIDSDGIHRWIFHGPDTIRLTSDGSGVTPYKCFPYPEKEVFEEIRLDKTTAEKLRRIIRSAQLGV